jgi:hypothetical protein
MTAKTLPHLRKIEGEKIGILNSLLKAVTITPKPQTVPAASAKAASLVGSKAAPKELTPAEVEAIIEPRVIILINLLKDNLGLLLFLQ